MNKADQTILVTGATGLAGSAIVGRVLSQFPNARVHGTYHQTSPFFEHDRLTYVQADLTTKSGCQAAAEGCDMAIMAAASTGGANAAIHSPSAQMTDNLAMDALMLNAIYHEGIRRVVYLSSATVYQEFSGFIKEDELNWNQDPHGAYIGVGWAKRSAEKICYFWHTKYDMDIIVVRCANVYGPFAKFNLEVSNFIPALIVKAVDKMDPFEVWGSPNVERDVIFADDLADAVVSLLNNGKIKSGIYNLGYGKTTTVGEVVELVLAHVDHHPFQVEFVKNRPTTIQKRALDCRKIQSDLNWQPMVPIEEGIARTVQWWEKNRKWWNK